MSWVTALVIAGVGVSEQIEGYAQLFPRLQEQGMITLHHLGRGDSLLVRADGDGSAVGVAAGHHQHAVSLKPVVAGEDVCGQVTSGHVAQVQRAVGVGARLRRQECAQTQGKSISPEGGRMGS